MKLTDYKNEEALELMADIIEPMAEILADEDIQKAFNEQSKISAISAVLRKYSKNVVAVLARIEGVPVKEYQGTIVTMTRDLLDIVNDEAFSDFFTSRAQKMD